MQWSRTEMVSESFSFPVGRSVLNIGLFSQLAGAPTMLPHPPDKSRTKTAVSRAGATPRSPAGLHGGQRSSSKQRRVSGALSKMPFS